MVVDRYFKDFVNRHWDIIKHRLNVDNQTMDHIRHELTHLNPMPGSALSESAGIGAPTIIPD
ncbi:RNA polymerase factor sigma-54, partial [Acinetobacter pittii]|uniref:RNA polymerase factor sigma-54 n=1 Tax=Acinetobacter pittii TaxID=48296 RepID=UPI0035BE2467